MLFSISRDMVNAPLPEAWDESFIDMEYEEAVEAAEKAGEEPPAREGFESCGCFPDRINGIWTFTSTWVRTFPDAVDPGMEALRQTLSLLLGPAHRLLRAGGHGRVRGPGGRPRAAWTST